MFSVNVPLPPAVDRLAADLDPTLSRFDRVRERHTLVCKRVDADALGGPAARSDRSKALARLREALGPVLADVAPFRVAVTGVDAFETPASGAGPVVYLTVASDGLARLHRRLCRRFDPVEGIEGDDYVPHVTLARGGDAGALDAVSGVDIDPIAWRVHALDLYDAAVREVAGTVELASG